MKLSDVKFLHSVKVGSEEIQTAQDRPSFNGKLAYDMELTDNIIKISDGQNTTYSVLSNVIWFKVVNNGGNDSRESNKLPEKTRPASQDRSRR